MRRLRTRGGREAACAGLAVALSSVLLGQAGPYQRQRPTPDEATAGARVYSRYCINCHGALAKGTEDGPDLIRSVIVMRDREGSDLGPALGRLPDHQGNLSGEELLAISNFLKSRIEATARNRNPASPPNVLTGDANAGRAYFNGTGGCSGCHSPSGDLAGVGAKYDPVDLQQRFLFPRRSNPLRVTVTPPNGQPVTGDLDRVDDFSVSLTDRNGTYRSFRRTRGLRVEIEDPLEAHHRLLDTYSDADIHNVVRYLETLQ